MKRNPSQLSVIGLAGLLLGLSFATFAEDHGPPGAAAGEATASMKMTPELKKDMADMYQKMADCLRTDKSTEQCSQDAMKNCPVMEKMGFCPIHQGMGAMNGKGMKHGGKGMKGKGMGMGNMKGMPGHDESPPDEAKKP